MVQRTVYKSKRAHKIARTKKAKKRAATLRKVVLSQQHFNKDPYGTAMVYIVNAIQKARLGATLPSAMATHFEMSVLSEIEGVIRKHDKASLNIMES